MNVVGSIADRAVTLPLLDAVPGLRYVVSTRDAKRPVGGDMSFSTGHDDPAGIMANRTAILATIGSSPDTTVMCGLVHGTHVASVTYHDAGRGARDPKTTIPETDALITDTPSLTLGMCFADCTPLLIVDPVRRAFGLGHAGWRGTVAGVAGSMVQALQTTYGSDPHDLLAVIGPAIGPEVYEVGDDVATQFATAFPGSNVLRRAPQTPDRWLLDLWTANARQFIDAGLAPEHVRISGICTLTEGKRFFSHRYAIQHNEREGRFAVFVRFV